MKAPALTFALVGDCVSEMSSALVFESLALGVLSASSGKSFEASTVVP
jgi:hypothetical protein